MKIAVIAANGRSGQAFVRIALEAGHQIRAGIFGVSILKPVPGLSIYSCDATKKSDVINLIKEQDAVVSLIGHVRGSPANVQTDAIKVIASAMDGAGINRIVSLTGTGVRFPEDKITFLDRLFNLIINIIDPSRVIDGINHAKELKQSDLDWTIIRVLKLVNGKPKSVTLSNGGPAKLFVPREEVARAVLEVLEQGTFIKKAPIVSK